MARNDVGKWVARAGATGGGRTYRGKTPMNWYALVIIVIVLGVFSVVYANYQYRHPASTTTMTSPKTTTTWFAGLAVDVCGTVEPALDSNQTTPKSGASTQSFFTTGTGVITIAPKASGDAGKKAVFGKFISGYKGLKLSSSSLTVPQGFKPGTKTTTYKNGEKCPKGTKDAGKVGKVQVVDWSSLYSNSKGTTVSGKPDTLKLTTGQLITVGFVPSGTTLAKPTGTVVTKVLDEKSASATTTTSVVAATTTTTAAGAGAGAGGSTTTTAVGATTTTSQ